MSENDFFTGQGVGEIATLHKGDHVSTGHHFGSRGDVVGAIIAVFEEISSEIDMVHLWFHIFNEENELIAKVNSDNVIYVIFN